MKGKCRIEIVIVVGLLFLALAIIAGIILLKSSNEHLDPIPAMIVSGFLGFLGRGALERAVHQQPTNSGADPEEPKV